MYGKKKIFNNYSVAKRHDIIKSFINFNCIRFILADFKERTFSYNILFKSLTLNNG